MFKIPTDCSSVKKKEILQLRRQGGVGGAFMQCIVIGLRLVPPQRLEKATSTAKASNQIARTWKNDQDFIEKQRRSKVSRQQEKETNFSRIYSLNYTNENVRDMRNLALSFRRWRTRWPTQGQAGAAPSIITMEIDRYMCV
jgi:hypothetical protein